MQTRPIVLMGLVLASLAGAGCQSYFPNGYGTAGPYSAFPQGGYGPPPGVAGPSTTFQPGRTPPPGQVTTEGPPLNNKYAPTNGLNNVPNPREPGAPPATLGTPANEQDETIRRPTGSVGKPPARLGGPLDESEETLTAFGEEGFATPRQIDTAAAVDDEDNMPRVARKARPNPYKYDQSGYAWLRGTVAHDPHSGGWRLRYSENPLDDEAYGGSLLLVGDDKLETLIDDEVVLVRGRVDTSARDRHGKPTYRVESLKCLKPREQ